MPALISKHQSLIKSFLILVVVISVIGLAHSFGIVTITTSETRIDVSKIVPETGEKNFCFIFPFNDASSDNAVAPFRSRVVLLEDGRPLSSSHSQHLDIREKGQGHYSHWNGYVLFSSSDNSDPRTNGRTYSVIYPTVADGKAKMISAGVFLVSAFGLIIVIFLRGLEKHKHLTKHLSFSRLRNVISEIEWKSLLIEIWRLCSIRSVKPYTRKQLWIAVGLLLSMGILIHTIIALGGPIVLMPDSGSYILMAKEIGEGTFALSKLPVERVPGYGAFIFVIEEVFGRYSAVGLKISQHLLGLLVNMMIFYCALMLSRGRLYFSLTVGLLSIISLQVVAFENWVMSETLYMFFLMSCVTAYLYALISRKNWMFPVAMIFSAAVAWVRPTGRLLWIALIIFWLLWLAYCLWTESRGSGYGNRSKFILKGIKSKKNWSWTLAGVALYILLISPQLINNYKLMGKLTLGSGEGLTLWQGVFSHHKIENLNNPEFATFVNDFNKWVERNQNVPKGYLDAGIDWRNCYFAASYLSLEKGMKPLEISDWMLKIDKDAIIHKRWEYMRGFLKDIYPQVTGYDIGTLFVQNADNVKDKYPWALEVGNTNKQYSDMNWVINYFNLTEQGSLFKPIYLALCNRYNVISMNEFYCNLLWWLILTGFFAGFLLFRRIEYLFILGILAYIILLPLIPQPPVPRFRYPVHGLLIAVMISGPWLLIVLGTSFCGGAPSIKRQLLPSTTNGAGVSVKEMPDTDEKHLPAGRTSRDNWQETIFDKHGFVITAILILLIRVVGIMEKGPYFLDEVSINLPAIKLFLDHKLVSIHPHAGFLFITGVMIKLFGLKPSYGSALMMVNIIGMLPMIAGYFYIRSWTRNNALAWMCAVALGLSGPVLFMNYMLYGSGPASAFVFVAACLLIHSMVRDEGTEGGRLHLFLVGLLCGIAYTCHECSFVMSCAVFGTMVLWFFYLFMQKRTRVVLLIAASMLFIIGFCVPILFFNNAVPLCYRLFAGIDYKELVTRCWLDYGFSGASRTYLGSILSTWSSVVGGNRMTWKGVGAWEMLRMLTGWFIPAIAAVGLFYCIRNRQGRILLLFFFICSIWFMGVSFSPYWVLRLMAPGIMLLTILSGCGWFQVYLWSQQLHTSTRIKWVKYASIAVVLAVGISIIGPGLALVVKGGTGYSEMMDYFVRNGVNFRRVLSSNHLASWYFLKNDIFYNNKDLKEVAEKYDYVVVETSNLESLTYFKKYLAHIFDGVPPAAVFDNPLGKYDYYPAEASHIQLGIIRAQSNVNGLDRGKLYIFKMKDARLPSSDLLN